MVNHPDLRCTDVLGNYAHATSNDNVDIGAESGASRATVDFIAFSSNTFSMVQADLGLKGNISGNEWITGVA